MDVHTVRTAGPEDAATIGAIATLAFAADPFTRWVWPDPAAFHAAMPQAARAFAGGFIGPDRAMMAPGAAAILLPPGANPDGGQLTALVMEHTPPERHGDLASIYQRLAALRPEMPHTYLTLLAVDPVAQGCGTGGALLGQLLVRCDAAGEAVFLETGNPRNRPFYERHGFVSVETIRTGAAPPITAMLRPPR